MIKLACVFHRGRGGQAQQGVQLCQAGVAAVFKLNQRAFSLAHIHLGLQHVEAGAQPHPVKSRCDALLILQAGQSIALAAHAFIITQIVQKLGLNILRHAAIFLLIWFWPSNPPIKLDTPPVMISLVEGATGGNRTPSPILGHMGQPGDGPLAPTPPAPENRIALCAWPHMSFHSACMF